jgi:hypothetical protein
MAQPSNFRIGWMQKFEKTRSATAWFSSHFKSSPGSRSNGEKVEVEIRRESRRMAAVSSGAGVTNWRESKKSTLKSYTPPNYSEGTIINVQEDLRPRPFGDNPYDAAYISYASDLVENIVTEMASIETSIAEALEYQSAQIFQFGKLDLKDINGVSTFQIDYLPNPAHYFTAVSAWSDPSTSIVDNLRAACGLIVDANSMPSIAMCGENAFQHILRNTEIQKQGDIRRFETVALAPQALNTKTGARVAGRLMIGSHELTLMTYNGHYKDPVTGAISKYMDPDLVTVMDPDARRDRVSCIKPPPIQPDPRVSHLMPGRISTSEYDLMPNIYVSANNREIRAELYTNMLMVPIDLDAHVTIKTTV